MSLTADDGEANRVTTRKTFIVCEDITASHRENNRDSTFFYSLRNVLTIVLSHFATDDVVYNQALGGPGGATMDKRRGDLRDELGYIAPPNRKLPPVPGSSYNTCDRIKRGTVISNFSVIYFCHLIFMLSVDVYFLKSFKILHDILLNIIVDNFFFEFPSNQISFGLIMIYSRNYLKRESKW